jgi:hypothetical protein
MNQQQLLNTQKDARNHGVATGIKLEIVKPVLWHIRYTTAPARLKKVEIPSMLESKLSNKNLVIITKGIPMEKSNVPQIVRATGMAWYRLEDYSAILSIMTDSAKLPRTFHEWRMKAETGEKKLRKEGHIVMRVFIDPKTFPDWCNSRGLNIDAQARIQFASLAVKETYGTTH